MEYWTREGLAWQRAARPHCLYAGHLHGQAGSSHVAISTCGGLVSRGLREAGGHAHQLRSYEKHFSV